MVESPTVSVITPAYNHEDYVQEMIKSIISQTYGSIEFIVLDDGSTDKTWANIQKMQSVCNQRFKRVCFATKENQGRVATLNQLFHLAGGKYVYIIASDDKAKPDSITKQVEFLELHPEYNLVVGDNELIDDNGELIYWKKHRQVTKLLSEGCFKTFGEMLQSTCEFSFESDDFGTYATLCRRNYIPNGYLIRRSALERIGQIPEGAPLEDFWMMLQLSKYGKMKFLKDVLFSYRWHMNNTARKKVYMHDITRQTLLCEYAQLQAPSMQNFRTIFEKEVNRIRIKFCMGNFLRLYKQEGLYGYSKILEIFGFKMVLKQKTYCGINHKEKP